MRASLTARPLPALVVVWLASALYVGARLDRGWVPHDEGALGHSAERILGGELPHRDFDEIYTGGLSVLNAAAFRLVGTNLRAPRVALFAVFLLWIPAVFYVAARFVAPSTAGLTTLLAVAWSLPNYSAAVPSWYNLFFATFGTAALLRHLETERARWLVAAGTAAGLSCLAKITGLYFIAAAILFFIYREQLEARADPRGTGRVTAYRVATTAGLMLLIGLLGALMRSRHGPLEILHFVLPGAALATFLVWHEWSASPPPGRGRFARLWRLAAPFTLGVVVPLAAFLVPYVASGSVPALLNGVFITPARRLSFAQMGFRDPFVAAAVLPVVALLGLTLPTEGRWVRPGGVLGLIVLLVLSHTTDGYRIVWSSMRPLVPGVVLAGALVLTHPRIAPRLPGVRRQQVVLLLAVAALGSLVQFPFSAPVYFLYVAPLAALAALAVASSATEPAHRLRHPAVPAALIFYIVFAVLRLHPGFIYNLGSSYRRVDLSARLALDRGGLRISVADRDEYTRLVSLLAGHVGGRPIYAAPDCPEVYFLAGVENPTRTIFDFFDPPAERRARFVAAITRPDVSGAVINRRPSFSGRMAAEFQAVLATRFAAADTVGRFVVRWGR